MELEQEATVVLERSSISFVPNETKDHKAQPHCKRCTSSCKDRMNEVMGMRRCV